MPEEKRQVIFVGGTAFSGSTFFHMMLANDPRGFAVGELARLFNPTQTHHVSRSCGCHDPSCSLWTSVLEAGEARAYETVFDLNPDITFVVDSSKSPFWIAKQSDRLVGTPIRARQILIWKSPSEIYSSMTRRGRKDWADAWLAYHSLYFTLIKRWRAIRYQDVVQDRDRLQAACRWLEIPYFPGKEEYWQRTHHIFGGNRTARFHLYAENEAKRELAGTFDEQRMQFHRKIFYSNEDAKSLPWEASVSRRQRRRIDRTLRALDAHDVEQAGREGGRDVPTLPRATVWVQNAKYSAWRSYCRWKLARAYPR